MWPVGGRFTCRLHFTSRPASGDVEPPGRAFTENNAIDVSIRSELRGSLHREISGGRLARGDVARGSATMNVRGTIGGNGSIDERCTKWIFLRTVSAGGWARRRAAMLANTKGTAPDSRFHWSPARCSGVRGTKGGLQGILSSASPTLPTPRGSPAACVRETDVTRRRRVWVRVSIDATADVCVDRRMRCALYRRTRYAPHTLAHWVIFEKDRRTLPLASFGAKSRARKRPSDWIDRNFKYILQPDGSSERDHAPETTGWITEDFFDFGGARCYFVETWSPAAGRWEEEKERKQWFLASTVVAMKAK